MAYADIRIAPARRALAALDRALSNAQDAAGKAMGTGLPATDKIAGETWEQLEKLRQRITKMIDRAERTGGVR
jgi:hypothetical protein